MSIIPLSSLMSLPLQSGRMVAQDITGGFSFERFRADVAVNAARLASTGCRRVALLCSDTYVLAVGLLAALHAGARPIFPLSTADGALSRLAGEFELIVGDGEVATFRVEPSAVPVGPLPSLNPEEAIVGFFTSGSSGDPKLVAKPLLMLEREVKVLDALWGATLADAPVLATVPHHHVYGLTFKVLWPLAAGRPFSRQTHQHWEAVAADMARGGVLVTGPSHLSRITGLAPLSAQQRPALVLSAGAPLPAQAAREATAVLGVPVTEIFGSSETGVIAHRIGDGGEHPWRMFPGVSVSIGDEGRLLIRSPFLAEDKWFETGDLAETTPNGFRLCGRGDRVAKIEGKRVSLPEVERQLMDLPWVAETAVAVLPGEQATLGAVVVLTDKGRTLLADTGAFRLGRLLRQALARSGDLSAMPRRWRFPESLPVNAMGKRRDADIVALFNGKTAEATP
ncbi:MAG: AMP-binding protein [Rhodospirillaceae bacterium]